MISHAAERSIAVSMDAISCLDDAAKALDGIEEREVSLRKEESTIERQIENGRQRLAIIRSQLSDLQMLTHRLARKVVDDKHRFIAHNETERRRASGRF